MVGNFLLCWRGMPGTWMHADEKDIDIGLVQRLLRTQAPHWADQPIAPVPSAGTDNALFRLGADKVVRLPRVESAAGLIEKERTWLPRLAPHLPLAVPRVLAEGQPGSGFPWRWSVYSWIDGEEASLDTLASPRRAAVQLAGFLAALRGCDTVGGPPAGQGNFQRGVALRERDAATRAAITSLDGWLERGPLEQAWDRALAAPAYVGPPRWLHGDLRPGNLLARQGVLCAVIDFGCLGTGDPACDLQCAWNFFSSSERDTLRKSLGVDADAWERGKGWALSIGLIALPYYRETNPVLAGISLRAIRQVLS
jgi:aminoglycoside phosphotransferase (APT) family kinase protein